MEINELKPVDFDIYCPKCAYYDKTESEDPCWYCLADPVNLNSHKPIEFKEKK